MVFTSNRSGDLDIWTTRSLDGTAWSWPTPVTSAESPDTNPCLFRTQTRYFLAFQSERPIENESFNHFNPGGLDSYVWITSSLDGSDWERPLQVTRKDQTGGSSVVNDTEPFLFLDPEGKLVLLFQRNVIASATERTYIGIARFDIGNKDFSQHMFDTEDIAMLDYLGHSLSNSAEAVNREIDPIGLVLDNGTLVVMANDMCVYSNGTQGWSTLEMNGTPLRDLLSELRDPEAIDIGKDHIIITGDSILSLRDLDHSKWEILSSPGSFDSPSSLFYKRKLHIAFESLSGDPKEDMDIHWFSSNIELHTDSFKEELLQGVTSLILGNDRSFGNQTIYYSEEGFLVEDRTIHYVLAFESTSSGNTDIWLMTSQDGLQWEGLMDITPSLDNELDPVLYSTNERLFVIYKVGAKIGSRSSSDLVNWVENPEIPPIESEGQKYFQRDKDNHMFFNETGVWYSKNFIYWKQALHLDLNDPSIVLIDQDNFLISSQNGTASGMGIDVYHLRFKSGMESDNILPTLIIILLVIVVILILLAMIMEIQR
jgi:hypothetical protein